MTLRQTATIVSAWLVGYGGLLGCSPAFRQVAPEATTVSSRVGFVPAEAITELAADGAPAQRVAVRPGELVRFEASGPFSYAERVVSDGQGADLWKSGDRPGTQLFRAGVNTEAIWLRGAAGGVFIARTFDPEYAMFDLERRVLRWADGPFGQPFPLVAPAARLEPAAFTALDQQLISALRQAHATPVAWEVVRAIRHVVALRALRSLRPPVGYPFSRTEIPPARGEASQDETMAVRPAHPAFVDVEGPSQLHVSAWLANDPTPGGGLFVEEGGVRRAELVDRGGANRSTSVTTRSFEAPSRAGATAEARADVSATMTPETSARAIILVPPGVHHYAVMSHGPRARVSFLSSWPVTLLSEVFSREKDEDTQLRVARRACDPPAMEPLCDMAHVLAGHNPAPLAEPASSASANPAVRLLLERVARNEFAGAEQRRAAAAVAGDLTALGELRAAALKDLDPAIRRAWASGTRAATHWQVVGPQGSSWTTWVEGDTTGACPVARRVVTADEQFAVATPWNGTLALTLVVEASCAAAPPMQLAVNGTVLRAQPSSERALWHVTVPTERVSVKRLDGGSGQVAWIRTLPSADGQPCAAAGQRMRAPLLASLSPLVSFVDEGQERAAPRNDVGLELWLREGVAHADVTMRSAADPSAPALRVSAATIAAKPATAMALDERGQRWTLAARVPLPAWANRGVLVKGGEQIAIRPLVRLARRAPLPESDAAEGPVLDREQLRALSRQILAAPPAARGALYVQRALLLADAGEAVASAEDARAAEQLGVTPSPGPRVARELRHRAIRTLPAEAVVGIEGDFDPTAQRCVALADAPQVRLEQIEAELTRTLSDPRASWDPPRALRTYELARSLPGNPRAAAILRHSLRHSRWAAVRAEGAGVPRRVFRPSHADESTLVPADGWLRIRDLVGVSEQAGQWVVVSERRPAKIDLSGSSRGAGPRLEFWCVPRAPSRATTERCPLQVLGAKGSAEAVSSAANGHGTVVLPASMLSAGPISLQMGAAAGHWEALARVTFARPVPGAVATDNTWVLRNPHMEWRYAVRDILSLSIHAPTLVRVRAYGESSGVRVRAETAGTTTNLPVDGTPVLVPVEKAGPLVIRAEGGLATLTVVERVPATSPDNSESEPIEDGAEPDGTSPPDANVVPTDLNDARAPWRALVKEIPTASGTLARSLGTWTATTALASLSQRGGERTTGGDTFLHQGLFYRQRLEAINLWVVGGAFVRVRKENDSYGGRFTLFESDRLTHLRVLASADFATQRIEGAQMHTLKARGFLEYSVHASPSLFVLPRVGYDGFYTSLTRPPRNLEGVEDEVYNPFLRRRDALAHVQMFLLYAPTFDSLFYARARASADLRDRAFSHAGLHGGTVLSAPFVDVGLRADGTYFAPTEVSKESTGTITTVFGIDTVGNYWLRTESFGLQPGFSGTWRAQDSRWSVFLFLNVIGSNGRGQRDFTSLEMGYFDGVLGGVPWRGSSSGVSR